MRLTRNRYLVILLTVLTVLLALSSGGKAAASGQRNYQIKQNDIYVKIHRDGSADVTQQVHYQLEGKYHGLFIVQDTKGLGKISQIQVANKALPIQQLLKKQSLYFQPATNLEWDIIISLSQELKTHSSFYQPDTNAHGDDKKGDYRIVTAVPANQKSPVITYHYRLGAVAKRYLDTGEINWKIIGSSWQRKLKRVNIKITLPSAKGRQQLWVHGAKYEHREWKHHSSTVKITARNVNQYLEVHLLFPRSAIGQAPLHHQHRLSSATKLEKKIFYSSLFFSPLFPSSYVLSLLVMLIPFLLLLAGWLRIKRPKLAKRDCVSEKLHRFDLPTTAPLQTAVIYQQMNGDDSGAIPFATEVADLQLKGKISVKENKIIWLNGQEKDSPFVYYLVHEFGNDQQTVNVNDIKNNKKDSLFSKWCQSRDDWESSFRIETVTGKIPLNGLAISYLLLAILGGIIIAHLMAANPGPAITIRSVVRFLAIMLIGSQIYFCTPLSKLCRLIFRQSNFYYSKVFFCYVLGVTAFFIFWAVTRPFVGRPREYGSGIGLSASFISQPVIIATFLCGIAIQLLMMLVSRYYYDCSKDDYQKIVEILQFKQMLHDMADFSKGQLPDETLWGEYYVYATAVGEAQSFIKKLNNQFGSQAVEKALGKQMHSDRSAFASGLITGTIIYQAGQFHSSSDSSGFFSSGSGGWGSSGGAGGDSGGGAF